MKTVKFRGRVKSDDSVISRRWVYGYLFKLGDRAFILGNDCKIIQSGGYDAYINHFIEVDPATVGMFTGYLDKNKKEIYGAVGEKGSDIILSPWAGGTFSKAIIEYRLSNYTSPEWIGKTIGDDENGEEIQFDPRCEIVGNMADNPELLKEKP